MLKDDKGKSEAKVSSYVSQQSKFDEDPNWCDYDSRKFEQIVKWQQKCEVKYGFDPLKYFAHASSQSDAMKNIFGELKKI